MDKQKTMKLGLLAGAAVLSLAAGSAQATDVCNGNSAATVIGVSTGAFITQGFNMNCSANVVLKYTENSTQIGVCAGSLKGNTTYGGSTGGGSVASAGSFATLSAGSVTTSVTGC
ncbi:hypothetical protein [Leeia oryzae]|uniref:hypothetical protein n=1 Tax=Leeia oryzae TaxID=356662 RepID=UPI0003A2794C|nr:hypothetical protein [Leeia oryzae]